MDLKQTLTDSFWNPTALASLPEVILGLLAAALLSLLLARAYIRFGSSMSNRREFAHNFLPLAVTTTLIISIVKSSLALSLGLVGALSIVRFRAAIKEPEELAFLFLAIAIGLGMGAGQGLITTSAVVVILAMMAIRDFQRKPIVDANLFLTVSHTSPRDLSAVQILEELTKTGMKASVRRFDEGPTLLSASYQVKMDRPEQLQEAAASLRKRCTEIEISCLDEKNA
ncbi:DUF4956 domain-containing protein [Pontiellaceae bacterium B1224]|nr:DUF4956 domain-containing protein [Pontiellaceae bacterium B1224]